MKRFSFFLVIILLFLTSACKTKPAEKEPFSPVFSTYKTDSASMNKPAEKNEIFYGLLTPVEICAIFKRLNIPYDVNTLNPTTNADKYLSNAQAALNTGIYGVDFGYVKMRGVSQEMITYMLTIREMSNKLGIPDNYLMEPLKIIKDDSSNPDSIMSLLNDSFKKMEDHLRTGGRESTAGLMVLGGWTEALYITTQLLYNPANPDSQVVQKIAEQKYTLATLLSFMKNYYDDPVVVYYTKKLKYLKNYFDTFDIYFKKGDLEIDNTKKIFRSSGSEMTVTVETLNQIRDYVKKLRTEMVTP